jgi:ribonuclease HI
MLHLKTFNTIRYLQKIHGIHLPVYHKNEVYMKSPCVVYYSNKVEILDTTGRRRYECAYLTNCENVVYVDGGCKNGFANIGIYWGNLEHSENKKKLSVRLGQGNNTSLEAELEALIRVLKLEWNSERPNLEIRTDNRTCVGIFHRDLNRPIDETERVKEFLKITHEFPKPLNIGWVKGHSDWEGNIQADNLTR